MNNSVLKSSVCTINSAAAHLTRLLFLGYYDMLVIKLTDQQRKLGKTTSDDYYVMNNSTTSSSMMRGRN